MWIIDSHVHIGITDDFSLLETTLVDSIYKYKIGMGIVSNIEGNEFDQNGQLYSQQIEQCVLNHKVLNFVKQYPGMFRAQYWIKPGTERYDEKVEFFIENNLKFFCGLKIHPFHSCVCSDNPILYPYYEIAEKYNLPVSIHTADDFYSDPQKVFEVALKFPQVNFIMVHMGLQTDHLKAIKLISQLPNLYGDTTWVEPEKVILAVRECGSKKILFGTDSPIDGIDTYLKYEKLIELLTENLTANELTDVLADNARKLFFKDYRLWRMG